MDIKIDENAIRESLDSQATNAVKSAFEGYSVRKVIEETISKSVIPGIISRAIENAASTLDMDTLSRKLGEEIAKSVTKGVQHVIRDTLVEIILSIKKIPEYDKETRARARDRAVAELDGKI